MHRKSIKETAIQNQPTFSPAYDAAGNQTLIRTATGTWNVQHNADNRPTSFQQGDRASTCVYDFMGRRIEKTTSNNSGLTKRLRYIHHGYVQIAEIDATDETTPYVTKTYRWDPSEPVATRPLTLSLWTREGTICETLYCAHDLRKNVVSLFDAQGMRRASYEYDPYGNITSMDGDMAKENPYRFSSEHHDEDLGLVYYNYRHYNPTDGRWTSRDPIAEKGGWNLYGFVENRPILSFDSLGLEKCKEAQLGTYRNFKFTIRFVLMTGQSFVLTDPKSILKNTFIEGLKNGYIETMAKDEPLAKWLQAAIKTKDTFKAFASVMSEGIWSHGKILNDIKVLIEAEFCLCYTILIDDAWVDIYEWIRVSGYDQALSVGITLTDEYALRRFPSLLMGTMRNSVDDLAKDKTRQVEKKQLQ